MSVGALKVVNTTPASAPPPLVIDRRNRRVLLGSEPVALGGRAFDVLAALTLLPGQVRSSDDLCQAAWPGLPPDTNNLRVQIAALRLRLGSDRIVNVARRGYQWTGPVQQAGPLRGLQLIGRDDELAALQALVAQHRLVTVAGSGGIGKTCLVQAWQSSLQQTPIDNLPGADGRPATPAVGFVALASVDLADGVVPTVCRAVAPTLQPLQRRRAEDADRADELTLPALVAALARHPEPPFIVIDNAEHLVETVATLVQALLDGVPALRVIVTSQVPLRLPGEHLLRLSTLELPDSGVTLAQGRQLGAIALFVERVQAVDPTFELTRRNLATVADICRRLDGLPLAIELAAARVPTLGLQAMVQALAERLLVLTGGPGHAPARQRTLRAALAWSYGLLDAPVREVFCQLGTFVGPFTLAQAQQAAAAGPSGLKSWTIADAVGRLLEVSLLSHAGGEPPRYRMLELPRVYALERLGQPLAPAPVALAVDPTLQRLAERVGAGSGGGAPGQAGRRADHLILGSGASDGGIPLAVHGAERAGNAAHGANDASPNETGVNFGIDVSEVSDASDVTDDLAAPLGRAAVLALARRLQPDEIKDFDGALRELRRAVEVADSVVNAPAEDSADGFVDQVLTSVAEQTRLGDIDRGADHLDEALAELQRREERRQAALLRSRRALIEAAVRQDLLRRDPLAVVRRVESLVALDEPVRPTWSARWVERESAFFRDGMASRQLLSLSVSIEMARRRLATAQSGAERFSAWIALLPAVIEKGRRETRPEFLAQAVQLCREAVLAAGAWAEPLHRAALQHQLSRGLSFLSDRGGEDVLLEEAERSVMAALDVQKYDNAPEAWAESQRLLIEVLSKRGQRQSDIRYLMRAAAACRTALQTLPSEQMPLIHARLLNELAILLGRMSLNDRTVDRLPEAVAACRRARTLVSREAEPTMWGSWTSNLSNVFGLIGEFHPDPETATQALRDAIAAAKEALDYVSEEADPVRHASRVFNVAALLRRLGQREAGTDSLMRAADLLHSVLPRFSRQQFAMYWAAVHREIGLVLGSLAQRQPAQAALTSLRAAEAALTAALETHTREAALAWAEVVGDLAQVRLDISRLSGEAVPAQRALSAWQEMLEVLGEPVSADTSDGRAVQRERALEGVAQAAQWITERQAPAKHRRGPGVATAPANRQHVDGRSNTPAEPA